MKIKNEDWADHLHQNIEFNGQIFVCRSFMTENMTDVNAWKKELNTNQEKPQQSFEPNVVVPVIFPNAHQVHPLFFKNGCI